MAKQTTSYSQCIQHCYENDHFTISTITSIPTASFQDFVELTIQRYSCYQCHVVILEPFIEWLQYYYHPHLNIYHIFNGMKLCNTYVRHFKLAFIFWWDVFNVIKFVFILSIMKLLLTNPIPTNTMQYHARPCFSRQHALIFHSTQSKSMSVWTLVWPEEPQNWYIS